MADAVFDDPRLAAVYDPLDPDRSDLDAYVAMVHEFGARRVLDIGCGTGTFALVLADAGVDVVGLDPAAASLDVARAKPGAQRVRWVHGDVGALPPLQVDLVTMTANVAQAIVAPDDWTATLRAAHEAVRPGGYLVFETRVPALRAWERWTREESFRRMDVDGVGMISTWFDLLDVDGPLVTFRGTWIFEADGTTLTSDSTLRFRDRDEVDADLTRAGFVVSQLRDAPDRPGREYVFVARRPH